MNTKNFNIDIEIPIGRFKPNDIAKFKSDRSTGNTYCRIVANMDNEKESIADVLIGRITYNQYAVILEDGSLNYVCFDGWLQPVDEYDFPPEISKYPREICRADGVVIKDPEDIVEYMDNMFYNKEG